MVKTRQKNFRSFIFVEGETEETIAYINKNLGLLKGLLLIFAYPLSDTYKPLYEYLLQQDLNFVESSTHNIHLQLDSKVNTEPKSVEPQPKETKIEIIESKESKDSKTLVLNRTIRSGEEILSSGDLTIFGRINSGAHIQSAGNLQIFGNISGNVFCDGAYMILGQVNEGNILFQGEIVDKTLLKYQYNKIYKKQNSIIVEELL